jgi:hypothetical protein
MQNKNQKLLEMLLDAEYFQAVVSNTTTTKIAEFTEGFKKILNCLPEVQRTNAVLILLGKTEEFNTVSRHKTIDNREVICEVTDYNPLTEEIKYKFETVKMATGYHNLDKEGVELLKEKTSVLNKEAAQKLVSSLTGNSYGHFPSNEEITRNGHSSLSEWLRLEEVEEEEEVVEEIVEEIENTLHVDYATSVQETEDAEVENEINLEPCNNCGGENEEEGDICESCKKFWKEVPENSPYSPYGKKVASSLLALRRRKKEEMEKDDKEDYTPPSFEEDIFGK